MFGRFILIFGKSGAGKTSLINGLITLYPLIYCRPISYTTRKKRINESNDEYQFISKDDLISLFNKGTILNLDLVYGNYYGIDKKDLINKLNDGKIVIKEIHPSNFDKIRAAFPDIITVYIDSKKQSIYRDSQRYNEDLAFYNTNNLTCDIYFQNSYGLSLEKNIVTLHEQITNIIHNLGEQNE